jgi:lysophospholipase
MSGLPDLDQRFVEVDGLTIRLALGPRPAAAARSLLLLNGRTEFVEKYGPVIADLTARGFHIATLDWRGQGASSRLLTDPARCHVGDFGDFQRDLDALLALAETALPKPWYALGHSMGALILLERLAATPKLVRRAVLSAPLLGLPAAAWKTAVGRPLVRLARDWGRGSAWFPGSDASGMDPERLRGEVLTTDRERFECFRALARTMPHYLLGGVTVGWVAAAIDAIDRLTAPGVLEHVTTPTLFLEAGHERIVCPRAPARVAARMPRAERQVFPGAEHELLLERPQVRDRVLNAIDRFLA